MISGAGGDLVPRVNFLKKKTGFENPGKNKKNILIQNILTQFVSYDTLWVQSNHEGVEDYESRLCTSINN